MSPRNAINKVLSANCLVEGCGTAHHNSVRFCQF